MDYLAWYNLVFEIPFFFSVIYMLLMSIGLLPDHGHDLDLHHDVHVGHDASHDVHHDGEVSAIARVLSVLGVGKVPISAIAMSFALIWSFLGFAVNKTLGSVLPVAMFFTIALVTATVGSFILTSMFARVIARIMPTSESFDIPEAGLIGEVAEVLHAVDADGGMARLRDSAGNLQDVRCVLQPGVDMIPKGAKVTLVDYNTASRTFVVTLAEPLGIPSGLRAARQLPSEN